MAHLLEVRNLSVRFHTAQGIVNAVKNSRKCTIARRCHGNPWSSFSSIWRAKNS